MGDWNVIVNSGNTDNFTRSSGRHFLSFNFPAFGVKLFPRFLFFLKWYVSICRHVQEEKFHNYREKIDYRGKLSERKLCTCWKSRWNWWVSGLVSVWYRKEIRLENAGFVEVFQLEMFAKKTSELQWLMISLDWTLNLLNFESTFKNYRL